MEIFFIANKNIPCDKNFPCKIIICDSTKDSADNYIFNQADTKDLVITRDIVFADRLVAKDVKVINDQGREFTKENIKEILADRNFDFALA